MEQGKILQVNGVDYEYAGHYVFTSVKGQRMQVTDFLVKNEAGGFDTIGVQCTIPENLEYIDIFELNEDCQDKIFKGNIIGVSEEDYK